ncbi:hypothetical protein Bca52824_044389 [Brassica carinata]|uniref:Uncharacterized protein n=1 Tax=Brassica carinata TaxID=52824 RepID=A0A8X7UZ80_BRACI|nr:hypothetical protein Bca52824_044389 [Brassica carinata]
MVVSYQEYVEIHSRCMRQLGLPVMGFMGAAKNKNGMLKLLYECAPKSFMLNKVEENDHMVTREYYIQPTKHTLQIYIHRSNTQQSINDFQLPSIIGNQGMEFILTYHEIEHPDSTLLIQETTQYMMNLQTSEDNNITDDL